MPLILALLGFFALSAQPLAQQPGGQWSEAVIASSRSSDGIGITEWVGDVNQDGHWDLLIGSPNFDLGHPLNFGRVSLVSGLDASILWEETALQIPENAAIGIKVSKAGDVDGDGIPDFAFRVGEVSFPFGVYVRVVSGRTFATLYRIYGTAGASADFSFHGLEGGTDLSGDGVPDFAIADLYADNGIGIAAG